MKSAITKIKLLPILKILLCSSLLMIACKTYAEYYTVYSGCGGYAYRSYYSCHRCGCVDPCDQTVVEIRSSYHHRHYSGDSGEMSEYEWVGDP